MQRTSRINQQPTELSVLWIWGGIAIALVMVGIIFMRMGLVASFHKEAELPDGAPRAIQITAADMSFGFETLRLTVGEPVSLVFENQEFLAHSFDVDELGVHEPLAPKGEHVFQFTPSEAGEFTIYCGVPGHREAGMVSTLIVEP